MLPEVPSGASSPSLRNLQILEVLANEARPLTATEINATLKFPKPTIHRLVSNLEEEGFLARHIDGRSYVPGPKLRNMMRGVLRAVHHSVPQREILSRLNLKIGETCNLSVQDGDAMIYIDRVETQWPLRIQLQVGSRVPLHATAAGKLSLAYMSPRTLKQFLDFSILQKYTDKTIASTDEAMEEIRNIRNIGHSTDNEEFVAGMIAVAVPVLGSRNELLATVSFHAPRERLSLKAGLKHTVDLHNAAAEISKLMRE